MAKQSPTGYWAWYDNGYFTHPLPVITFLPDNEGVHRAHVACKEGYLVRADTYTMHGRFKELSTGGGL